jgi:hypothetical protein
VGDEMFREKEEEGIYLFIQVSWVLLLLLLLVHLRVIYLPR